MLNLLEGCDEKLAWNIPLGRRSLETIVEHALGRACGMYSDGRFVGKLTWKSIEENRSLGFEFNREIVSVRLCALSGCLADFSPKSHHHPKPPLQFELGPSVSWGSFFAHYLWRISWTSLWNTDIGSSLGKLCWGTLGKCFRILGHNSNCNNEGASQTSG